MNKQFNNKIKHVSLDKVLQDSYLNYAMSVIISRALPDVRDGLKPVHRRIFFSMLKLNNVHDLPYKKSARIVGEVIGKYHPHGDQAVYETIVRMAQPFTFKYTYIDGQGNFGSIDGDSAAAMRYTEIRNTKYTDYMIDTLDKNTVDYMPNYDDTQKIPIVLPFKIPNLLINGSYGIAVGMATNIPPHNITEVINGCLAYIDNHNISIEELMNYIIGPDFPTGGKIKHTIGLLNAYKTGKGKIIIQSKYKIMFDKKNNRKKIIFYEIPYQTNKSKLIETIAMLIKNKKIEGIYNVIDESDKDGVRIVIEIKTNINNEHIINLLYKFTSLQIPYYINMVALKLGTPKLMNLKEIIQEFIDFRCDVINRKNEYNLNLYKKYIHILEGYLFIITNINKVLDLIKNSINFNEAQNQLLSTTWKISQNDSELFNKFSLQFLLNKKEYFLSEIQVQYILKLKLYKLNYLEHIKIIKKYKEYINKINYLTKIFNNKIELLKIIKSELIFYKKLFYDQRSTTI